MDIYHNAPPNWRGTLSIFNSVKSAHAREIQATWAELAERLKTPEIRADKEAGALFSAARFAGGRRKNKNAVELCALVLDYDNAPPMSEALTHWAGGAHLAYTTWSHATPDKGNAYRVVIPLIEPIPAAQYPALWAWAHAHTGGLIDPSCKDAARIMYLPACPNERAGQFQFIHHHGPPLDWRALPLESPPKPTPTPTAENATTARPNGADYSRYVQKSLDAEIRNVCTAQKGARNITLNRSSYSLGQLVGAEWAMLSRGEAERALLAAATNCGFDASFTEHDALATIASGLDAGEKEPRPEPENKRASAADFDGFSDAPAPRYKIEGGNLWAQSTSKKAGGEISAEYFCIGAAIEINAETVDGRGGNHGRLLSFQVNGKEKTWVMPMEFLAGDTSKLLGVLLSRGYWCAAPHLKHLRDALAGYINSVRPPEVLTTTDGTGWHGKVFVLTGGEMIGEGEKIIFTGADTDIYAPSGTLADWQNTLAARCVGNSRLEFAVSLAFAGILMPMTGDDGAGCNFYGPTSTGKTTTQVAAASVWGSPAPGGFISKWNATSNGLEGQAVQRNHTLFCIDELGEVDPKLAGRLIYQLASGVQKGRATATTGGVGLAALKTWKLPFISSAEKTLAAHVEESGQRLYGGQAVRCVDIPADAGAGFGVFENLHGLLEQHNNNTEAAGAAFSDWIKSAATTAHGTAGREFVAAMLKMGIPAALKFINDARITWTGKHLPPNASGVGRRAAKLFSLAGAAGELAIRLGVLPWKAGAALGAAGRCFHDWLAENGEGNPEERAALAQLRHFIQARWNDFRSLNWAEDITRAPISRQVGYVSDDFETVYILTEIFKKDACKGYRPEFVLALLAKSGALVCNRDKRYELKKPGARYVYAIRHEKILPEKETGDIGESGKLDLNYNKNNRDSFPRCFPDVSPVAGNSPPAGVPLPNCEEFSLNKETPAWAK